MIKHCIDFIISFVGLILLFPIFIFISILIITKIGRPIVFTQTRPGFQGKPFKFYKFRSMTQETDARGALLSDRERLIKLGIFLRKYSLDELPSIWNVLKGDMSLVGPRPLLTEYLSRYSAEQARRHEVKPGITGWAQINGRNAISWEEKFKLDVWYVDNKSFLLDLKILFITIFKVLTQEGINQAKYVTMEKFSGNN